METDKAKDLIDKYLKGDCTPEEKVLLERFYIEESENREVPPIEIDFVQTKTEIFEGVNQNINTQGKQSFKALRWLTAASVVLVLGISILLYRQNSGESLEKSAVTAAVQNKAEKPDREAAILTLADGSKITLDAAANGELSKQADKKIVKLANGQLIYQDAGTSSAPKENIVFNTLSIPRGSYYHLTLSDGSDVWLNSASSITFPASFPQNERSVTITGEAYFEVARNDKNPFIVRSGEQEIQVLGTHFNVMAYLDENAIITTLLEGSVKIVKNAEEVFLKPGQAASNSVNGKSISISNVDPQDAVAWKEGYFKFDNEPLESIMKKLSRWYDADIEFIDNVGNIKLWGTYARSKSLNDLLETLEQTGDVHFKVEGRRIIVMK